MSFNIRVVGAFAVFATFLFVFLSASHNPLFYVPTAEDLDPTINSHPKFSNATGSTTTDLFQTTRKLREKILERCRNLSVDTTWNFTSSFRKPRRTILRRSLNLLYGCNPKTGSSSFKKYLFLLDGVKDPHHVHDMEESRDHYSEVTTLRDLGTEDEFRRLVKFTVVRNPLTRLVSAFRDKQLSKLKYLKPGKHYPINATDFEIFKIFLSKVIFTGKFQNDIHLQQQWHNLAICSFPYDVIADYEHSQRVIDLVRDLAGAPDVTYPGQTREERPPTSLSSDDVAEQWLAQLDPCIVETLQGFYAMDFILFGYTRWNEKGFPFIKEFAT